MSACLCVRLSVCSLLRYCLNVFLRPLPEVGCPIFLEIWNPWGKVMHWMAQQIRFEFFSKPMAPNKVIMASTAQPWGQKRTTLTQEVICRLLNCSKELSCAVKQKHLSTYMQMLKNSGYNQKFRAEVLESGLSEYRKNIRSRQVGDETNVQIEKMASNCQADG